MFQALKTRTLSLLICMLATGMANDAANAAAPQNYAGQWTVNTGSMLGPCQVTLLLDGWRGRMRATSNCMGAIAFVDSWEATPSGFRLVGISGSPVGTFAPSGNGMVARLSDGATATATRVGRPTAAVPGVPGRANCIRNPATQRCAVGAETSIPRGTQNIRILSLLNMRARPTYDSNTVGQLKAGLCVQTTGCFETSAEMRCEIPLQGGGKGFIIRFFERDGQTYSAFATGC